MASFFVFTILASIQLKNVFLFEITYHESLPYSGTAISQIFVTSKQEALVITDIDSFILNNDLSHSSLQDSLQLMNDLSYEQTQINSIADEEYIMGCTIEGKIVQFTKTDLTFSIQNELSYVDYCSLIKNTNNNHYYLIYGDYSKYCYEEYIFDSNNHLNNKIKVVDNVFSGQTIMDCAYITTFDQICCLIQETPPVLSFGFGQQYITISEDIEEAKFKHLYDDKVAILVKETERGVSYYLEVVQITKNEDSTFSLSSINKYSFSLKQSNLEMMEMSYINNGTILLTHFKNPQLTIVKYYFRSGDSYSQTISGVPIINQPRIIIFNSINIVILFSEYNNDEIKYVHITYPSCSNFEIVLVNSLETALDFNNYIDTEGTTLTVLGFDIGLSINDTNNTPIQNSTELSILTVSIGADSYSTYQIYYAYFSHTSDTSGNFSTNECIGTIIFTCNDEGESYKPLSYYTKNNEDKSICVPVCSNNWFINSSGDFICTSSLNSCTSNSNDKLPYLYDNHCVAQCPSEASLSYAISSELSQCLSECPSNAPFLYNSQLCVNSCQTYKQISYHNICNDECPNGYLYEIDIPYNSCKPNLGSVSIEDIKDNIDQSILNLYEDVDIVKTESFILGIYNTSKEDTELMKELSEQNGLSLIDLGSCEGILKKQYSISNEEPLIIVKIELERENEKTNQLEYAVYSLSGEKFNLEYCNKANIVITSDIKNTEGMDIDLAIELAELGIDIYDSQDDFFNDLCYSFTSVSKTDVILNDRRTDYFRNISFCEENCEYSGIDLEKKKVNCTCEAKTEILSKETVKTFAKQFKNTLSNSNFKVIQCIGNVFSIDIFTNNVGNYFMVFMILCNISCLLFYIIYGIDNLKKTMYLSLFGNDISNPPNRSDEDATCDVSPVISKCKTAKSHFSSTNFIIVMKPTLRKKGTYNMVEKNTSLTNSAEFKSSHDLADIHNDLTSIAQIPKYDKYEINYIKYEEAVKYDKRTKMSMFLSILVLKHPLIYAFFINDKYTIKSISISMFIISEQMGLAFNALFYTDGYISNQYKHEGNIDIIASLPKSIYSSLFSVALSIIFGFLTSSKSILMKILLFSDQKEKDDLNKVLRCIRIKLAFYFTLIFIFSLFFWYYVTAFCAVYQNSQVGWLIGAVISVALGLITPVAMSLFVFIFRVIGIEKKSKCCYKVSTFLL